MTLPDFTLPRVSSVSWPECLVTVQEVLTGGDVISPGAVARVLESCPDTVVRAMYGATEATVFSTSSAMTAPYRAGITVPVGRALDGVELHVLDERLDKVPAGTLGQLYISGVGTARGYFRRPDLTAQRFVANPFSSTGERMYRTGDFVRLSEDGVVEFAGRANDQVKVHGFRVELAEIESVLAGHPGVAHVAVVAREVQPGDKRLVAYAVAYGDLDIAALRERARDALPEYMVPAAFIAIEKLPLTANGKLDRAALPVPEFDTVSQATYEAPSDSTQETLCTIFSEILNVQQIGVNDSFFDLGGHSLLAMRLISRIRSEFGVELPVSTLFNTPTVAGLARNVLSAAAA
jgi:acyl-coenzyme A synthetase/AMP-(fatty) acid ligase/acyl carrier protein